MKKKYDYRMCSDGNFLCRGVYGPYGYEDCESFTVDGWMHDKDADDTMFGWTTSQDISEEEARKYVEKYGGEL